MAGINLAKNWCAKLIFFQIGGDLLNWEKNSFLILNWLCFAKQSQFKIKKETRHKKNLPAMIKMYHKSFYQTLMIKTKQSQFKIKKEILSQF